MRLLSGAMLVFINQIARINAYILLCSEAENATLRVRPTMSFNIESGVSVHKCMSMFLQRFHYDR